MDCSSFDGQLVRPTKEISELARQFICVRVTDMRNVNLNEYQFDYDLTIAILLANASGDVYHRYGGRDHRSAGHWMNLESLAGTMRATLAEHRGSSPAASRPMVQSVLETIESFEVFREKEKKKKIDCIHCHMVHDALRAQAQADRTWKRTDLWVWPSPARLGIDFDPKDQQLIMTVAGGSPAARAGIRPKDRMEQLGDIRILTFADASFALQISPQEKCTIASKIRRGSQVLEISLELPDKWKESPSSEYAWRPFKWGLHPQPGFGGQMINESERASFGVPPNKFALRITYIVDWGEDGDTGRRAMKAGLKKGDIILSANGKSDFVNEEHFQAWVRLDCVADKELKLEVLRGTSTLSLSVPLVEK